VTRSGFFLVIKIVSGFEFLNEDFLKIRAIREIRGELLFLVCQSYHTSGIKSLLFIKFLASSMRGSVPHGL